MFLIALAYRMNRRASSSWFASPSLLTKQILAIVLASLGPLAIAFFVHSSHIVTTLTDVALGQLSSIATIQQARVRNLMRTYERTATVTAARGLLKTTLTDFARTPTTQIRENLSVLMRYTQLLTPSIVSLAVIDNNNKVVAASDPELLAIAPLQPSDVFDRETLSLEFSPDPRFRVIAPVMDRSSRIGSLIVYFSMQELEAITLDESGMGSTGETVIGAFRPDNSIQLLTPLRFRNPSGSNIVESNSAPDTLPMKDALNGVEGMFSDGKIDYRGVPIFAATRYVPEARLGIVAKIDKSEALRPWYELLHLRILTFFIIFVLTTILSIVLAKALTRRIVDLTNIVERISSEDATLRAPANSMDELGILGARFNELVDRWTTARKTLQIKLEEQKEISEALRRSEESVHRIMRDIRDQKVELERVNTVLRKEAAERQQAETRFSLAVESSPTAMVMTDGKGSIQLVNRQAEKVFGYDRSELLEKSVEMLVPERFRGGHPGHRAGFYRAPGSRPMGAGRDLFGRRKDGSEFPVEIGLNPVQTETGIFVLSSIVDITERKMAEEHIKKVNEQLQQVNEELRRSNNDLDDFAYVASHDLKEPLRGLQNYASFLLNDYGERLDADGKEMLDSLVRLTKRLEVLISSLLHYSRVNREELDREPTDLNELIKDISEMLRTSIDEHKVDLRIPEPLPTIWVARTQAMEVFQNLISNAIKYNDKSERWVEIGRASSVRTPDKGAVWYVKDNGIGVPEKHFQVIFRIFKRLNQGAQYGSGAGVGLTIAKKIVERHGGEIWVESEKGAGTTFYFSFGKVSESAQIRDEEAGTEHIGEGS